MADQDPPEKVPDVAPPRLGRRLTVLKLALVPAAAALGACVPVDRPMVGRTGLTDSDPSDPAGAGRGSAWRSSGLTDSDPSDPPGAGRGGPFRRAVPGESQPVLCRCAAPADG